MALDQWARIEKQNAKRMKQVAIQSAIAATDRVIMISPVATGLFKNNWVIGINAKNTSKNNIRGATPTGERGQAVLIRAIGEIKKLKLGDTVHVSNNLHYAWKLEYGFSKKAPAGMVRITVANWQLIVANEVRKIA